EVANCCTLEGLRFGLVERSVKAPQLIGIVPKDPYVGAPVPSLFGVGVLERDVSLPALDALHCPALVGLPPVVVELLDFVCATSAGARTLLGEVDHPRHTITVQRLWASWRRWPRSLLSADRLMPLAGIGWPDRCAHHDVFAESHVHPD